MREIREMLKTKTTEDLVNKEYILYMYLSRKLIILEKWYKI